MSLLFHSISRGRTLLALLVTVGVLLLILAFGNRLAAANVPIYGAAHGPTVDYGTDLQCAAGRECGPNNPATKVAPSPKHGPKQQP
jgi:hypothetical protein